MVLKEGKPAAAHVLPAWRVSLSQTGVKLMVHYIRKTSCSWNNGTSNEWERKQMASSPPIPPPPPLNLREHADSSRLIVRLLEVDRHLCFHVWVEICAGDVMSVNQPVITRLTVGVKANKGGLVASSNTSEGRPH